jgi:O-antigen ligase
MTTATIARPAAHAAARERGEARPFAGRAFAAYLVLAAALAPFVVPPGPAQLALLDGFNLLAIAAFLGIAFARRVPVVLPFFLSVCVIAVGSLLATTNAVSVGSAALSLAQDAYLYLWLVALVAIMSRHGDLRTFRLAWVLVGNVIAVVFLVQAWQAGAFPSQLLAAEGFRPAGTFYGANMGADYLVATFFIALSLWGQVRRLVLVPSFGLLLLALLVTKSNGSLIALVAGLAGAAVLWALRGRVARTARLGAIALVLCAGLLAAWVATEWGPGAGGLAAAGRGSILGRMEKSSAGRSAIWGSLGQQLARNPLGIGPGNSVHQAVAIGQRVRPGTSLQSKEAHSDYMGYAVERGPIGLLGLLLFTAAGIVLVHRARPPLDADAAARRRLDVLRAAFIGGLLASAVHSAVIEKLHFRHAWLFLATACAVTAGASFRPQGRETP